MKRLINFDQCIEGRYDFGNQTVPEHTQLSLELYLLEGIPPGGFLTAILENQLFSAVRSADQANKENIYGIAKWIQEFAPAGSWGCQENVKNWCNSDNPDRLAFKKNIERELILRMLQNANPPAI